MSSKLFAFQMAKLVEPSKEEVLQYDPETQMQQWRGATHPQASGLCTGAVYVVPSFRATSCLSDPYGNCSLDSYDYTTVGYTCD